MPVPPPLNPRVRRLLLQVVLVGLFGATLAAAAWVRNARLTPAAVALTPPIAIHYATVRMPAGWGVRAGTRELFSYTAIAEEARDPYGQTPGRALEAVVEWQLFGGDRPERYLQQTFQISASTATASPTTVAGQPGVLVQFQDPRTGEDAEPIWHVYACAILPQRYAVTVHLQVAGRRPNVWDLRLLSQVAESVTITSSAKPAAGKGEPTTKPDGGRAAPPKDQPATRPQGDQPPATGPARDE